MESSWAYQKYFPYCKVARLVVAHVPYSDDFEAVLVCPEDLIVSRSEDVDLTDLYPSLLIPKPAPLPEVPDQVNKIELCK